MHIILRKHLEEIKRQFELEESESKLFEIFCNYCIVSKSYLGRFNPFSITTKEDDASIDGIAIVIDGDLILTEEDAIQTFESHKTNLEVKVIITQAKSGEKFSKDEIANFNLGLQDFLSLSPQLPNGDVNIESLAILNVVFNNLKKVRNKLPSIEIYYCTSGVYSKEREISASFEIIKQETENKELFYEVKVEPLGRAELSKIWNSITAVNEAKLKLIEYYGMPPMPKIPQSYVGLINAKEFVDKALKDENGNIKNEVFEENIRAFLGNNSVNSKISETVNDLNKKRLFSVLNNGITIVTPELTLTPNSREIDLKNYQIINGCQTSNTLFNNYEVLDDSVNIVIKCIESTDEEYITNIISATNNQTQISETAFYSLKEKTKLVQKIFEIQNSKNSSDSHIYFERRENEYKDKDYQQSRIFDIKLLSRCYNSMFLNQPHNSARYISKIFEMHSDDLFKDSDNELLYFVSALTHYRFNSLINGRRHNANKYSALRWHTFNLFKFIVHKKIEDIKPNSNKVEKYCHRLLEILTSANREYENIFVHCFNIIESIHFPTKDSLKRAKYNQDLINAAKEYIKTI